MSSNNLAKYEYLTGEDLGLKPSTVEQAKFEYYPLGKKKGLFKRLKNIENAQKNLIRDDDNESIYCTPRSQFDGKDDDCLKSLSQKAKDLMNEIKAADGDTDKYKLAFTDSNKKKKLTLTFLGCH